MNKKFSPISQEFCDYFMEKCIECGKDPSPEKIAEFYNECYPYLGDIWSSMESSEECNQIMGNIKDAFDIICQYTQEKYGRWCVRPEHIAKLPQMGKIRDCLVIAGNCCESIFQFRLAKKQQQQQNQKKAASGSY
jgi:hypothetical protein